MSSAGSLLAELLHRVDHFLLKIIQGTGFAQIESFSRSVLRKILKVEGSLTIGKELNSR
jgi:MFS-type transporter involved in bile tolerance (Atg22 family)